ncbi:unnamed protein product, partial [Mesorhabditis belari]|uniref:Uncharacterized protein n=1 Tax=Mesorhabditis belari TaxID=2138241 RepID=A0AAF3EQG8_9BILA
MAQLAICVFFLFISTNGVTAQIGGTITASSNCKRVQCGVNEICNSCGQVCEQRCGHPLISPQWTARKAEAEEAPTGRSIGTD